MDEVIDRIKRIKKSLESQDEEVDKNQRKIKQQRKKPKEKNNSKNKIQKKKKINQPKEPKTSSEVKLSSDLDEDNRDQVEVININEIKEIHQRMQSHLVNLTKIIIKNQSLKSISQEINSELKKNSFPIKKKIQPEEEIIRRKKPHKNQSENFQTSGNDLLPIDDSIPLPIDFSNQKASTTSSNSSFLLHERDLPNYYNVNHATAFNLENFMNNNAARSILKKSKHSNEADYNFDSKSDLKTSDLNSITSLIEDAKKVRSTKKTHFSSEEDRIPGEILMISSENNGFFPVNSNDSDILNIPFIPEKYSNDNESDNNHGELISTSISSDDESRKVPYDDVEITDELKARYLDQPDNTKTRSFSAIESPILKGTRGFECGEDIDFNNLYDIDEGCQASLEDY